MKKNIIGLAVAASVFPMIPTQAFANDAGAALVATEAASAVVASEALESIPLEVASSAAQVPVANSPVAGSYASQVFPTAGAYAFPVVASSSAAGSAGLAADDAASATVQDGGITSGGSGSSREPTYTVSLNQDSFFGFYPAFNGLIPVNETMDFSFYGIFWTKPAFGLGQGNTGDDLWTEFGVGVNFNLADGRLKIKPQIGITNGSLLSGGSLVRGNTAGARFLDGIVPSLTVNYSDDKFEAEYYGGYYAALRQREGTAALDFLHTWLNFGYKVSSTVSFGPHYELLYNTRNTYRGGSSSKTYEWLGGYVQIALQKGFFARFTGGTDMDDDNAGDFYKMSIGMSF